MPTEEATTLLARLKDLTEAAEAFLRQAAECVGDPPARRSFDEPLEPDHYWSKLSEELRNDVGPLVEAVQDLGLEMAPEVRRSPGLTEADERDLGSSIKAMRASLRLRRYRSWDPEVLHDEGQVLGVQPAGQSDREPLHPIDAIKSFQRKAQDLADIVTLLTVSSSSLAAQAGPAVGGGSHAVRPGTAFIMMWMDPMRPELTDVSDTVKRCFSAFGIDALRAHDIQHEDLITKRILDQIRTAEFLFADLTGERPSVYYEVAYAHALGRRVILFRQKGTAIHFDLAGYNCPEYENLHQLEEQLTRRLQHVTGEIPRASGQDAQVS